VKNSCSNSFCLHAVPCDHHVQAPLRRGLPGCYMSGSDMLLHGQHRALNAAPDSGAHLMSWWLQVIALLEKEVSDSAWFGTAFLIDGFPRAVPQAEKFEERVRPCDLVLYFECPENVMVERLTERGKSSGREDDNPDTVKERLHTFQNQSLPVVDFYKKKNCLHRSAPHDLTLPVTPQSSIRALWSSPSQPRLPPCPASSSPSTSSL
jgi:hypothetical protein